MQNNLILLTTTNKTIAPIQFKRLPIRISEVDEMILKKNIYTFDTKDLRANFIMRW